MHKYTCGKLSGKFDFTNNTENVRLTFDPCYRDLTCSKLPLHYLLYQHYNQNTPPKIISKRVDLEASSANSSTVLNIIIAHE